MMYASDTPKLAETHFHEIPFSNGKIEYKRNEASTLSFTSPEKLSHGTRIKYVDPRGSKYSFGGQVYKTKESVNGFYDYDVISYTRLYLSKSNTVSYSNLTSSQIIKKLLKANPNNLSTSGITKTTNKHSYVKWEKASIWEIAQQLQWLEYKAGNAIECYVNADGILIFGKTVNTKEGYHFSTTSSRTNEIIDYEDELATEDIVTAGRVIYNGKTKAYAQSSANLIATWGLIEGESFDCTEQVSTAKTTTTSTKTTATTTDAKAQAFISKYHINSKIVKLAQEIVGNSKSDRDKAKKIWNWMRDHIPWVNYACTRKGALGTLNARKGNCADQTHLYMSLAGSVGLDVRCNHIDGHFFPETKLNGKWFPTDTTTRRGWGGHACNGAHWAYHYDPNKFNC